MFIIGLFAGVVNGLLGIGGGTIVIPALVYFYHVEQHKAHGSSLATIFPTALISALVYGYNGQVDLAMAVQIAVSAMVGGYLGAKLMNKIPACTLKRIFGIFMMAAGIRMVL